MTQLQPIPLPDYFPVDWDSPEDVTRFWTADLMHWPHGISPLAATMDLPSFFEGLKLAADALCLPFRDPEAKVFNGYVYNSFTPWSNDPAEVEQRMGQMQEKMMAHLPGLLDRWANEYEPEIRAINDDILLGDYSKLGDGDLAALLESVSARRVRQGEVHFLAVMPMFGGIMFFEEVYGQLFGEPEAGEHLQLLQGFPNKSVEVGDALWRLAKEARSRPAVLEAIRNLPAESVHEELAQVEGGPVFRDAVTEFCSKYGWRAAELDMAYPTWYEDPAPVYKIVREYAARDDYNPEEEFRSLVAARRARENALIGEIPAERVPLFKQALELAQQYLPIQEDHNFWIDQQGLCVSRIPTLEAGRRLASANRLRDPSDVFYLHFDELLDALRGGKGDLAAQAATRRSERERQTAIKPPPAIGTPTGVEEDPIETKFFGGTPPESPDPRIINGNAASAGTFTGTARVILTLDDAHRLKQGEILVCPATMPPWTPLFGIASAVVTDHGGVLSHTAIVAREYQIPAVVGTKIGTSVVEDGQRITVDGTAGTVKLES